MAEFNRRRIFSDFRAKTRNLKRDNRAGTELHQLQTELCWRVHEHDMAPSILNAEHCSNFIHRLGLMFAS